MTLNTETVQLARPDSEKIFQFMMQATNLAWLQFNYNFNKKSR